jgi:phytoene desaturase
VSRERPRAAVIGSGFGGLALAIRLQAAGIPTTLVERRDRPGGRAYVYEDEGFVFDAGPTVITAPGCLEELFEVAGRRLADHVELMPVTPFYRLFWEDGLVYDYSNDPEDTRRQIAAISPRDVLGYERFLAYAEEVFEQGYTRLAHVPFLDFRSMVKASPQLARLQAWRSVYSAVSRFIEHPRLRETFSFHSLLVGGNPFSTSAIYTLIHFLERKWGVHFPRGGTGALVEALVALFRELGGELRLGCDVDRILTRNGRVSGLASSDGWQAPFEVVASNADVVHTYGRLLRDEPRAAAPAARLRRMRHSMSLFLIYFGTRRRHPHLAHHNVLFGPRYRELLADIFDRGVLADDFSLYLHAPTVSDPSLAPPGCESFYVLAPVPHLGRARIDWKEEGPRYADRILDYLEKRYIPGLRGDLVTRRIFTPLDFEHELNAHLGSAFSLEPVLWQSAWFRVHNRDSRIGGLYFAGAGTHPGAGIPGVVNSAKATAGLVLAEAGIARPEPGRVHA